MQNQIKLHNQLLNLYLYGKVKYIKSEYNS